MRKAWKVFLETLIRKLPGTEKTARPGREKRALKCRDLFFKKKRTQGESAACGVTPAPYQAVPVTKRKIAGGDCRESGGGVAGKGRGPKKDKR